MSERVISGEPAAVPGSSAELAALLVELERSLVAEPPARVVLADDSDRALAAALVATKLLIPLVVTEAALGGDSVNAGLIAQLAGDADAGTYTSPA